MIRRLLIILIGVGALTAYAQTREKPSPPTASPAAYRVTPWPAPESGGAPYEEELQGFLNKMADDGWRFHSDLSGQFGKLMVFERSSGR